MPPPHTHTHMPKSGSSQNIYSNMSIVPTPYKPAMYGVVRGKYVHLS